MRAIIRAILLSATACVPATAFAQTAQTAAADDDSGLQTIIVTARKTEEKLQDVPLSIRALTGKDLQERGITSVSDLSLYTPGLSYSPDFGRTGERPVIRGISSLRPEAPQPVSVFVNGIFVRDGALSLALDDAERVEVIKGPQSALYGRSTYAGAINYITVKPGNEVKGRVSATLAGSGERSIIAAVTLPIIPDVLSVRIRGKHYEFGGQYTNSQTGRKIGQERTNAISEEISFTPSTSFDARLSADFAHDRDGLFAATIRTIPIQAGGVVTNQNNSTNVANGGTCNGRTINIVGNQTNPLSPLFGLPDATVPATAAARANGWPCGASNFTGTTVRRNQNDLASYIDPATGLNYGNIEGLDRRVLRLTAALNFHFGDGYTLTSLTGYTHQTLNTGADQSYNGTRFAPSFLGGASWLSYDRDRLNYASEEIRLSSPQDKPFSWLIGGFYYKEKTTGITTGVIRTVAGAVVAEALRPKSQLSSRNIAAFGRIQYAIGDALKVSAEGRYGEERVSVGGSSLGVALFSSGVCVAGQPCSVTGSQTFKNFAPRVTVDYKVAPDVLVYAQAAKGTKSGGFNSTAGLPASSFTFNGESVWSYEAGLKSEFFSRRLRFNLAVFQNDVSGLQLSNIATYSNPFSAVGASVTTTVVNNVGKARTRGFELEVVARPVQWLTLSGNYAYTDAKALVGTETTNGTVFGGNRSVAGSELPRSPKHSAAGSAAVDFPVGASGIHIFGRGDLVYQSRRYAEIQNLIWANPFTRLNFSAGLYGKGWRATGFVKNAADDTTSLNGFRYLDPATFRRTAVDFLPKLRQYGATLAFDF